MSIANDTARLTHAEDGEPQRQRGHRQDDAAAGAVDQLADADAEERADECGDEIDLRERDAADLQISQERLGDEAETLGAAGQRADHRERGHAEYDPPVIEALAHRLDRRLTPASVTQSLSGGRSSCRF